MWTVKRFYNGTVGIKTFDTKEEAENWLKSDKFFQDKEDRFIFSLEEVENYDN